MEKITIYNTVEAERLNCCGIIEINGISDNNTPRKNAIAIIDALKEDGAINTHRNKQTFAYILFTEKTTEKSGKKLATFIRKEKLGSVHSAPSKINGNTGNHIKAYLWSPIPRLLKWRNSAPNINYDTYSKY